MRRIIVDCTHTHHTGAGTGIQRVVRRFADALLAIGPGAGVSVVPVRLQAGACLPLPVVAGRVDFPRAASARESASGAVPSPGGSVAVPADALAFGRDDIFLSLDSSWVYDIRPVLEAAGAAGATRCAFLHDVLPLSNPQWFTEGTTRLFREWVTMLLPRLEGVVGNSRATCAALGSMLDAGMIQVPARPPCRAVHLGADLAVPSVGEPLGDWASRIGAGHPPAFLTVGTLEPRKNHAFALDMVDCLAAKGLDFQWHFAGAPGWMSDDVVARLRRHPDFGTRLFWWTDLRDEELTWLYRHCSALVAVSHAEGFGLPLVEARQHGLPVFASNIAVFREVLGSEARYLPLSSAALAAVALEDFLLAGAPRGGLPSSVARSWEACATELLQAALSFDRGVAP